MPTIIKPKIISNIVQQQIVPNKPKILANEQIYVYVPRASTESPGIASFNDKDFLSFDGHISLSWPMKTQIEEISNPLNEISRVKLLSDEFEQTGNESEITNPLTEIKYISDTAEVKLKRTNRNAFLRPELIMLDNLSDFEKSTTPEGYSKYTLKRNNPLVQPALVKLDNEDFNRKEDETVDIRWPYAHNASGTNRTDGYGLIKINPTSKLFFTGSNLLDVDLSSKLNKDFTTLDEKTTVSLTDIIPIQTDNKTYRTNLAALKEGIVQDLVKLKFEIVDELPNTGETNIIYLLPEYTTKIEVLTYEDLPTIGEEEIRYLVLDTNKYYIWNNKYVEYTNIYKEYIWLDELNKYEQLGTSDIELYANKVAYDKGISNLLALNVQDAIDELADIKVDKVEGSSLITSDELSKLSGIDTGAQVNTIEVIKVDNTPLTINEDKEVNIDLSGKVDKTIMGDKRRVYGVDASNNQELIEFDIIPTENSNNLVTSGSIYTGLSTKEPLLAETPEEPEDMFLGLDGTGNKIWKKVTAGISSSSGSIYLSNEDSDVDGYKMLSNDLDETETVFEKTANNDEKLIATFLYDKPIGVDIIDAGTWHMHLFCKVSDAANVTRFKLMPFAYHEDETETDLFAEPVLSQDINNTSYAFVEADYMSEAVEVLPTDRIGVRISMITNRTSPTTASFKVGNGYASFVALPLALRHPQLRGLNDDPNYQHISSTEKTNLGNAVLFTKQTGRSEEEKAQARANIGAGASGFSGSFTDLTNVPDTLSGYGITDAVNKKPDGTNDLLVSNKLSPVYVPDFLLGQMLYGGTFNATTALATLSANAKAKLGTENNTITLTNNTAAITGYTANEGIYYLANAVGTFAGISFEVGDWLVSTVTGWGKVDNTDAVTGVKGDSEVSYRIGNINITKDNIGLGNVENTSDADKPVSTLQATAIELKVDKTSIKNTYDNSTTAIYSSKYIEDNFAQMLYTTPYYANKATTTTADLTSTIPTLNSANYLTSTTTNTAFNWTTPNFVFTNTLTGNLSLQASSLIYLSLPFSISVASQTVNFGYRVKVNGVAISSNQTFGAVAYTGGSGHTDVNRVYLQCTTDSLTEKTNYVATDVLTFEVFTQQATSTSMTTRAYCGATIGGVDYYTFNELAQFKSQLSNATPTTLGTVYGQTSNIYRNTFYGYQTGINNTTGYLNTFTGYQAGYNNTTGEDNVFYGYQVGYNNTTGYQNTAVGKESFFSNTSGYFNTAIGRTAMSYNTTGYQNTAVGCFSLNSNTTGNYNTGIGKSSLLNNKTGNHNVAIGNDSLWIGTNVNYNVAIGSLTLEKTTSDSNVAIGYKALNLNTSGGGVAIGSLALENNTTGFGIAIGSSALNSNTTGIENIAVGLNALNYNTTGSSNIAIGDYSGTFIGTGLQNFYPNSSIFIGDTCKALNNNDSNQIVIGYNTTGHGSNTATWGNTSITDHYFTGNVKAGGTNLAKVDASNLTSGDVDSFALKLINKIYPVGSIYMSVVNTSPASFIGGTWEQLQDRFLLGAGTTYTAGNTGGEATHTLTIDEMPSHRHTLKGHRGGSINDAYSGIGSRNYTAYTATNDGVNGIQSEGGGQAHNNMPPYLVVYMWKRTA